MSAQERITKLEALLERVRERGTRDDAAPSAVVSSAPVTTQRAASPVAAAAASGIPEVTVGREREITREIVRDPREEGRRISNVPASVRGTTDQELPSVIIAPPPSASSVSPISAAPVSSMELDADDVIEAEPAPVRSLSRPPPPPPARSPSIPPQNVPTPLPVSVPAPPPAVSIAPPTTQPATQPSTPAAQAAHAAANAASLNVPTPPTAAPSRPAPAPPPASASVPAASPRQPYIPEARQSENRLGDADITAGHPVSSVDVQLDDEVPTPSSSRRPRSEHAPAPEDDEISPPPHTVPPESGRMASVASAESGKRSSVPAVEPERIASTPPAASAPASVRPDIASGRQAEAQVATFTGEPTVAKPATFGELLDNALSL